MKWPSHFLQFLDVRPGHGSPDFLRQFVASFKQPLNEDRVDFVKTNRKEDLANRSIISSCEVCKQLIWVNPTQKYETFQSGPEVGLVIFVGSNPLYNYYIEPCCPSGDIITSPACPVITDWRGPACDSCCHQDGKYRIIRSLKLIRLLILLV